MVVDRVTCLLEEEIEKEAPLTKTRSKVHDYLGTTLDFSQHQKVRVSLQD